jgi:hypothetical protein
LPKKLLAPKKAEKIFFMSNDAQVARALDRLCANCEQRERNEGYQLCQQCHEANIIIQSFVGHLVVICNQCGRPCVAGQCICGVVQPPAEDASYEELVEWERERNSLDDVTKAIRRSLIDQIPTSTTSNVDEICVVCQDTFENDSTVMTLKCGHFFHKKCFEDNDWLEANMTCPVCKSDIS